MHGFIYLFKFIVLMQPFGYERPTPHLILTDTIHSDTQAEPRKLSSLTLYIDLWQEGKPAPGQNPPVISPPVVIFRRIGVRAEIRTQNPVLSNTRLAKMVPLSHLRRRVAVVHGKIYRMAQRVLSDHRVLLGFAIISVFLNLTALSIMR
jgi:hypothetical protein